MGLLIGSIVRAHVERQGDPSKKNNFINSPPNIQVCWQLQQFSNVNAVWQVMT